MTKAYKTDEYNIEEHKNEEYKKAKLRALRILTRMDKTEADLKASLKRAGFSSEAIQVAVDYVNSYGYLNDRRYAEKYVEYHKNYKSRQKLRYELMQKGVRAEDIDHAFEVCQDMDELSVVRRYLKKKWTKEEKPTEKELSRLFGSLSRQGFSSHDIWTVLREENLT